MANTIQLRRSATANAVPTTTQLALGELAINTYDGKLYLKKNVSGVETIVDVTGGGGGASISVSDTSPASPVNGSLWWNSNIGVLKIYYNDGTSSQWVDASHISASSLTGILGIANGGTGSGTAAGALTALGAYPATNPSGYTANTGTVTSVGGTGTVSGLTLSGTVTGSGNLTLGGTLSLTSGNVTTALGFTPYNATNPSGYITSSSLSSYLPLTGGTLTGALTVPANATTSGGGVNFAGAGSTFIRGTSGDGASSTTSNLQLQSWFGIGFGPSISGQTVPIGENAAWLDCRSGSFSARADFRAPIFYDSNNTAYYVSPDTGSRLVNTLIGGNEALIYEGTTNVLNIRSGPSAAYKYFGFGTDGRFTASNGGITATSDARATIFYDVDNTAYYLNPNGDSFLVGTTVITRNANSNDVFGGLELRENNLQGAATGAASEAPGLNFHWSNRGAARIYMNGAGNFVFAGQSDITNNRRDIIFASGYAATRVDAPIFYDTNDTTYYVDPNSTSVMNAIQPWGEVGMRRGDSGTLLRSYNTSAGQATQFYVNHNLGEVEIGNARGIVYGGGTYWQIANSVRAPIFYDSNNTGYYTDPAGDSNVYKTFTYLGGRDINANWNTGFQNTPPQSYNFHGDISSGGPSGSWWFYESRRHSNASNYWGTQIAWGWEDNANRLQQRNVTGGSFGGWVEYLNTSDRTYNGNLYMTGSIRSTSSDMRAPIFYDQDNTGYYVNAAGTSYINALNIGPTAAGSSYLNINGYNAYGGTGFHGFLTVSNTYGSATNPNQYWRINAAGGFEIVNSPYNAVLFTFTQGGDFTAAGNVTAYSDRKLKTNFEPISNAVQKVMELNGVTFTRVDKEDTTTRYAGLIAQDVEPVLPEAVQKNDTMSYGEVLSVDYNGTIALLVEAIKEQQEHIKRLEEKVNSLGE